MDLKNLMNRNPTLVGGMQTVYTIFVDYRSGEVTCKFNESEMKTVIRNGGLFSLSRLLIESARDLMEQEAKLRQILADEQKAKQIAKPSIITS